MIALDEMVGSGVLINLQPGTAWAIYMDEGPEGPCGQLIRTTSPHGLFHVWPNEDLMRKYIAEKPLGRNKRARVMYGVVGEWSSPGVFSVVNHCE